MTISNYGPLQVVNTSTTGDQYQATAGGLASGKIIIGWYDDNLQFVRTQELDALGNRIGGELPVNQASPPSTAIYLPRIAADTDGGFVLGYVGVTPGPTYRVGFIGENSNGTPSLAGVADPSSSPLKYMVAKPLGDHVVFAFETDVLGGDIGYGSNIGSFRGSPVSGLQTWPDLAVLAGDTRYVISWWDDDLKMVKCRLFASDDNALTPDLTAGSVGTAVVPFISAYYRGDAVAALVGGNFVVVWNSLEATVADQAGYGIQASLFDQNGGLLRFSFQINASVANDQRFPSVVGLLDGGFAVAWTDFSGSAHTVLRTFDASGNPTSADFVVDGVGHDDRAPQLTLLADGRIAVTWEAYTPVPQDMSLAHVEMQIVDPRGGPVNLSANDVGADLVGTAFDDSFLDGLGNDRFTGNGGFDTVSFARATSGVTVDLTLATGQSVGGGLGTDKLLGIHKLLGSFFNDQLTGSAGNDTLTGGPGSDTFRIRGSEGLGDIFSGGTGVDTLQVLGTTSASLKGFNAAAASIEVWAGNGKGLIGTAAANSFNLSGLAAKSGLPLVDGGAGNDSLSGSKFADDLRGNAGSDTIKGNAGNDHLTGGAGKDTLTGGLGSDFFVFNAPLSAASNVDKITDFSHLADTIQLSHSFFPGMGTGSLKSTFFFAGTHAHDADDHIIYNKATGALYYDSDGTGAHAQVLFAVVADHATAGLAFNDFVLI